MKKLYCTRALLIKAVGCFCLPLLQNLLTSGSLGESLAWLFFSTVLLGCLYCIPFWCSLVALLHARSNVKLSRYIGLDALCCLLPAVLSSLLYECCVHMFVRASAQDGLYTVLLSVVLLLISGIFWFLYRFAGKHNRP